MHDGITLLYILSQSHWRRFGVFAVLKLGCVFVDVNNCSLFTVTLQSALELSLPSKGWMQSTSTGTQYDNVAIQPRGKFRSQYVKPHNIGVGKLLPNGL